MKNTMKALNLHAVGDLRYEDVPMPVRQAGEVLLKVHACARAWACLLYTSVPQS